MVAMVAKWGNSLALRIPQYIVKEIQITEGTEVELMVLDGNLVVKPKPRRRYSLEELVAGITPENLHSEVESGVAVGNEAW
ncbi:AbrB/MazE/SpoVT family DNA-binding domain-containing protein [Leptolyngbyaceae cyanobacterium CCMR0082]|uniref:AbrB/MazE/SpoVT family DNA-binding domain-containing protein n=2 Tax=Adonisia turfae TaxID=2950184 RepID=A0A6M0SGQ6_9CYAN|nr:AbrB/MazE/SpoVT family DNA-binding domain-containing protein [Adonisia turfae]MDV3350664.1 AbrB/MazE/SpoVT family DNA-binding domain-containing protein [Leptothoe sp. LEGE 181152]NEZ60255.1 AbrB/MazE/SpoVT family DNA-binding domain-containing protein [Adonisia turfae CCMR0081]NEZ67770.1 AbrB/MazE/SpoVT family DNA-binding domain-containing protein [Adonisia turfae CCMR0082]